MLVLDILEEAVVATDYLYVLQGSFYARDSSGPVDSFERRGIARDRRDQLAPLLQINGGLLVLSLVLYPVFARLHGRYARTLGALAVSGVAAFVVGRLLARSAWAAVGRRRRLSRAAVRRRPARPAHPETPSPGAG